MKLELVFELPVLLMIFQNKRHLEIFDLSKDNRFNITGEFTVEINDENQNYKLVAIHPNKTIVWVSDYSSLETRTYQSSKLELAPNVWLGYNVEILNHTKEEVESQEVKAKLSYPARDVSVGGLYTLKDDSFSTDLKVKWLKNDVEEGETPEEKVIESSLQWQDHKLSEKNEDHQSLLLGLKHPSFDKDLTINGSYYRDAMKSAKVEVDYVYTEDEDHHAKFTAEVKNWSEELGYKNYTVSAFASHPASSLNLLYDASVGLKPNYYRIEATGLYKISYLAEMELDMVSFIDVDKKEIKFYVSSSENFKSLKLF